MSGRVERISLSSEERSGLCAAHKENLHVSIGVEKGPRSDIVCLGYFGFSHRPDTFALVRSISYDVEDNQPEMAYFLEPVKGYSTRFSFIPPQVGTGAIWEIAYSGEKDESLIRFFNDTDDNVVIDVMVEDFVSYKSWPKHLIN